MQHEPNSNYVFFELLRFPVTETYHVNDGTVTLAHRGAFQVIHNPTLETFLLKLGSLDFALDKSLYIVKAFSDEEKYPAYLIPSFAGFYLIKVLDNNPNIALNNLETILDNTCVFRTKSGLEQKLGDVRETIVDTKLAVMREVIHKTKDVLVKTFTPQNHHPNYTMFRTFEELKNVNTNTIPIVDITPNELQKAKLEVDEVTRSCQTNKYWSYFCEYAGTPLDKSVSFTNSKSETQQQQQDQPKELFGKFKEEQRVPAEPVQEGECDPKKGCDNIDTVHTEHATEAQEVVGTENQRLPSYEVHHSKEHVEEGLDKVFCRLEDAKLCQSEDMPPLETCQIKEDPKFTSDLFRPVSAEEEQVSRELGGSLPDKNKPADTNKEQPAKMLDSNGDPYRRDLVTAAEMLTFKPKQEVKEVSDTWGSNVSDASDTTAKISELGLSSTTESFNEKLTDRPLVISGNLTHSQSLNEKPLTASPTKDNLSLKQTNNEKKQRNVSDQAIEKENATLA